MSEMNDTPSVIEIPLTKGFVTIVDAIDGDLAQLKWFADGDGNRPVRWKSVGKNDKRRTIQQIIWMHRLIMERVLGRPLIKGEVVDHINGDTRDNQRKNLRTTTSKNNSRNRGVNRNNTSGYKGVTYAKDRKGAKKWRAQIKVDYKRIDLGCFETAVEAHHAYVEAANKYFGEFVRGYDAEKK